MRQWSLVLLLPLWFSIGMAQAVPRHQIASVSFDPGSVNGGCVADIQRGTEQKAGPPPKDVLTIKCGMKQLLRYASDDAAVDIFVNYPHPERVFVRWEGGAHVTFTAFWIAKDGNSARVVFERKLEGAPDVVNTPDVLLVHSGKRWVDGEAESIPLKTEVYTWTGETYKLSDTWSWEERMRYKDRFCVLDPKNLSCPVSPIPTK